jgi:two-component system, LuxR family, sensor kinase FixL
MTELKPFASAPPTPLGEARQAAPKRHTSETLALHPRAAGLFLAVYVVLEWVSFIHEYKGVPATPWNPGLGVAFALMVFAGPRYGIVLFAGVVISEIAVLRSSLEWWVVVAIAGIIAVGYGSMAWLVRRQLQFESSLDRLRDVLLLLAAGFAGCILVALLLPLLLLADGKLDRTDVLVATAPLVVGDFIGIAVMAPLALRLWLNEGSAHTRALLPGAPELLFWMLAIGLLTWLIVRPDILTGFNYFYLLFVPVVVVAVRHGLDGACVALAVAQFALVAWLHIYGYDATAFTEVQVLMLVLTSTGLIVGVIVTERRSAQREINAIEQRLRLKEAEAEQASRVALATGMASALAHEINQPMTAARALARAVQQILRMPQADLPRAEQNLMTLIAQIDHAAGVVRHMRDFLRRGRPHVSTVDVRAMVDDTLTLVAGDAAARKVRIETRLDARLPQLHGDRIQIQQVFLNLIRNAMEAIEPGRSDGRIVVTARRLDAPPRLEFSIADNGPGVAPMLVGRLFEPLTTSKHDGLGLGLPISASIVEAHGGRIWHVAESTNGAEFHISIPLELPAS